MAYAWGHMVVLVQELNAKWDMDVKKWYIVDKMTDESKTYEEVKIDVPHELKDHYK